MFARYTVGAVGPIDPQQALRIADALDPLIRQQPGFQSITWLYSEERGEYGSISICDTMEHAEATSESVATQMRSLWEQAGVALQGLAPTLFTVYEVRP